MARLKRAGGWRGLALAIGAALAAGLIQGTLRPEWPGAFSAVALTLVAIFLMAIGGVSSARRRGGSALLLAGAMAACFAALRWGLSPASDGIPTIWVIETAAVAATAAAACWIGRDQPD